MPPRYHVDLSSTDGKTGQRYTLNADTPEHAAELAEQQHATDHPTLNHPVTTVIPADEEPAS